MSQLAQEYTSHFSIFTSNYMRVISLYNKKLMNISLFFLYFRVGNFVIASSREPTRKIISSKVNNIVVPTSLRQFRSFSSQSLELGYSKLNPSYVTGFADAEGCFLIKIYRRSDLKLGYSVNLAFQINLHLKDKLLLEKIRNYFYKIGNITVRKNGSVEYGVNSIKDLEVVINHFDNYPLITKKRSYFQIFKLTFELIKQKQHLVKEGLHKILSLKASINLGLSDELKTAFPNIVPFPRPKFSIPKLKDQNPH